MSPDQVSYLSERVSTSPFRICRSLNISLGSEGKIIFLVFFGMLPTGIKGATEGVELGPGRDGKEIETKKWKFLPKKLLPMEQVVRLTTRSDRLGSLDGLVRQHSILPPRLQPSTNRAKYAMACVICPEGLHKVTLEPNIPPNTKSNCAAWFMFFTWGLTWRKSALSALRL